MPQALAWLATAKQSAPGVLSQDVTIHDPVPMPLAKLAHYSRAQLLVESRSRKSLQAFLREWLELIRVRTPAAQRDLSWQLEVDPQEI
jgi:primosomal protein N' (replication factor Y) (superfamily II helicase)